MGIRNFLFLGIGEGRCVKLCYVLVFGFVIYRLFVVFREYFVRFKGVKK